MPCTIVPHLMGGLGNWLFQVAAAVKFAQDLGLQCCLVKENMHYSPHSKLDYFSTILSKFNQRDTLRLKGVKQVFEPPNFAHTDYRSMISTFSSLDIDVYLLGYFQHHEFIPRTFKHMLTLPIVDSSNVQNTCFLHIRGGDYVNHSVHDVKLSEYYRRSIQFMKKKGVTKFSVFTNDRDYALQLEFLKDVDYEFVYANELDSLVLMSECQAGICANSSFSWWGAYLNRRDRPICMPSRWFNNDINISCYYFPGVAVIDVS